MSGLMNWDVSRRRSSTVSRARCTGALSCWDNANNQKYVLIVLLKLIKWLLWIFLGKVATADRWDGQIYKLSMSNFLTISSAKNYFKNRLFFETVIQKNKKWTDFLGHSVDDNPICPLLQKWDGIKHNCCRSVRPSDCLSVGRTNVVVVVVVVSA